MVSKFFSLQLLAFVFCTPAAAQVQPANILTDKASLLVEVEDLSRTSSDAYEHWYLPYYGEQYRRSVCSPSACLLLIRCWSLGTVSVSLRRLGLTSLLIRCCKALRGKKTSNRRFAKLVVSLGIRLLR